MSHEYFNQGSVDMLCDFLGDNPNNYSQKNAFSDVRARHQLKFIPKGRSSPRPSAFLMITEAVFNGLYQTKLIGFAQTCLYPINIQPWPG
jgi:hypothetical protein